MQLRAHYRFGKTLKNLDLEAPAELSYRGHHPAYAQLEAWYNAEAQASMQDEIGKLPKMSGLIEWQHVDDVMSAYWADPSNLRRGAYEPPEVDYTGSTHLHLMDGRDSLKPKPPRVARTEVTASPRARCATATAVASSLERDDAAGLDSGSTDSAAPPPDYAPPFPTNGYWLPPLSRPLTSLTYEAGDLPLKPRNVIPGGHRQPQRQDAHLPATWSLSPTPLSKENKQRYTLYPTDHNDHRDQVTSQQIMMNLSPFTSLKQDDIAQLRKAAQLIKKRKYRDAFEELTALIDIYPDVARLYTLRAKCASKQGGHKVCLRDAKKATELDATETQAYYWGGISALALGKPKIAKTFLQNGLKANPSSMKLTSLFETVCEHTNLARSYHQSTIARPMNVPKARHGPNPPTPEPELEPEKTTAQASSMPADWEHIDISDMVYEQTLLRDSILMALSDGVTASEVTIITNMMKRAGHNKTMIARVEDALGDGDMDNDDIQLVHSLLPPEPIDDWMRIVHPPENTDDTEDQSLEGNYGYLRTLFRHYAVEGTVGTDGVEDLSIGQFKYFAKEIQIMDKRNLNAGAIDRMFIRANQDRSEGVDQFDRENMGKALKEMKGARGSDPVDNKMGLKEFVAGMIRMAHAKFKKLPSLADRWDAFMSQHVKKHGHVVSLEDDISTVLQSEEVKGVLNTHADMLAQAFLNFCVSEEDFAPGMDAQAHLMKMSEWMHFVTAAKLLDDKLTVREARVIFVQVNMDDDLFVQEDTNNSSSELVLDEFIECLVRVAWEKDPLQSMTGGDEEDPQYRETIASCLSEWFALAITPYGQKPKKKNRRKVRQLSKTMIKFGQSQ